jgi:hypothetical protein
VKESKAFASMLEGAGQISVYWHQVQVTVLKGFDWTSKTLLRKRPAARNSSTSHSVFLHLGQV